MTCTSRQYSWRCSLGETNHWGPEKGINHDILCSAGLQIDLRLPCWSALRQQHSVVSEPISGPQQMPEASLRYLPHVREKLLFGVGSEAPGNRYAISELKLEAL